MTNENRPQIVYVQQKGRGAGGAICGIASFFIPGLGQLVQGRILAAIAFFCLVPLLYLALIVPGVIAHIYCVIDAARRDGEVVI